MKKNCKKSKPIDRTGQPDRYIFDEEFAVVSSNDFTGLMPAPAASDDQERSYGDIYDSALTKKKNGRKKT